MPITEALITGVNQRTMNRKSDGKPFSVFTINTDKLEKLDSFNKALAQEANRLLNQRAEITYHVEQNGQYENYVLDDVTPIRQYQNQDPFNEMQPQRQPAQEIPIQQGITQVEKEGRIVREAAAKVSAHLSSTPAEFWGNIDDLVTYFETGTKPARFNQYIPPAARDMSRPEQQENQFVPANFSNDGWEQNGPNPDADIPF